MDVDAIRKAINEEQKAQFRKEGHCFECNRQGHMARSCPSKKNQGKTIKCKDSLETLLRAMQMQLQPAQEEEEEEEDLNQEQDKVPPDVSNMSTMNIATRTAAFTEEECLEWIQDMESLGMDFINA